MKPNRHIPPRWIRWFLSWRHPENTLEEPGGRAVESYLDELYAYWYNRAGNTQPTLRYLLNVVSVLPPFVRRQRRKEDYYKPSILNADMIRNYFKIAWRNLDVTRYYQVSMWLGFPLVWRRLS